MCVCVSVCVSFRIVMTTGVCWGVDKKSTTWRRWGLDLKGGRSKYSPSDSSCVGRDGRATGQSAADPVSRRREEGTPSVTPPPYQLSLPLPAGLYYPASSLSCSPSISGSLPLAVSLPCSLSLFPSLSLPLLQQQVHLFFNHFWHTKYCPSAGNYVLSQSQWREHMGEVLKAVRHTAEGCRRKKLSKTNSPKKQNQTNQKNSTLPASTLTWWVLEDSLGISVCCFCVKTVMTSTKLLSVAVRHSHGALMLNKHKRNTN